MAQEAKLTSDLMSRCLYLVPHAPITMNGHGGGSALFYNQLMMLKECGFELHLLHFCTSTERETFERATQDDPGAWRNVLRCCESVSLSTDTGGASLFRRVIARLWSTLRNVPITLAWQHISSFRRVFSKARPEFIWAHHYDSAVLSCFQGTVPVVYSHHDWLFRIKALRNHRPEDPHRRASERQLVKRMNAAVAGSITECEELRDAGCGRVHYIPVSYPEVTIDWTKFDLKRPRLVHLGGMGATANREGLTRFMQAVWPQLGSLGMELEVIGDMAGAPAHLMSLLANVCCRGFVASLSDVLRPGDIHIIPWEHNTGQRTRIPLAFSHGQVIVATRAAVACLREVTHELNALLVSDLNEMAATLSRLAGDPALRDRLARNARRTFEESFTDRALLPRYRDLLGTLYDATR